VFYNEDYEKELINSNKKMIVEKAVELNYKIKIIDNINKIYYENEIIYIPKSVNDVLFIDEDFNFLRFNGFIYKVWYLCKNKKYKIYTTNLYEKIFGIEIKDIRFKKKVLSKVLNLKSLKEINDKEQKYYKISSSRYKGYDNKYKEYSDK